MALVLSMLRTLRTVLTRSWFNVLLPCVPAGLVLNAQSSPAVAILVSSFLSAIPVLGLGDQALDAITARVGTKVGLLLYTSARYVQLPFWVLSVVDHASGTWLRCESVMSCWWLAVFRSFNVVASTPFNHPLSEAY